MRAHPANIRALVFATIASSFLVALVACSGLPPPIPGDFGALVEEEHQVLSICDSSQDAPEDQLRAAAIAVDLLGAARKKCTPTSTPSLKDLEECRLELKTALEAARKASQAPVVQNVIDRLRTSEPRMSDVVQAIAPIVDEWALPILRVELRAAEDFQGAMDRAVASLNFPLLSTVVGWMLDEVAAELFAATVEAAMAPLEQHTTPDSLRRIACRQYRENAPRSILAKRLLTRLIQRGHEPVILSKCGEYLGQSTCEQFVSDLSKQANGKPSAIPPPGEALRKRGGPLPELPELLANSIARSAEETCPADGTAICDTVKVAGVAAKKALATAAPATKAPSHRASVDADGLPVRRVANGQPAASLGIEVLDAWMLTSADKPRTVGEIKRQLEAIETSATETSIALAALEAEGFIAIGTERAPPTHALGDFVPANRTVRTFYVPFSLAYLHAARSHNVQLPGVACVEPSLVGVLQGWRFRPTPETAVSDLRYVFADHLIRKLGPLYMDRLGKGKAAADLRALGGIENEATARAAMKKVEEIVGSLGAPVPRPLVSSEAAVWTEMLRQTQISRDARAGMSSLSPLGEVSEAGAQVAGLCSVGGACVLSMGYEVVAEIVAQPAAPVASQITVARRAAQDFVDATWMLQDVHGVGTLGTDLVRSLLKRIGEPAGDQ
jgi:hypothetical protein